MEIISRGLQMERTQLRLGLVIALVITVNSVMLVSSIGNGGQYVIAGLAFASMFMVEYLLAKQSLNTSKRNVSVLHQLGAKSRSITISVLARFLLFGFIGILGGYILGVTAIIVLQPISIMYGLQALLNQGFIAHLVTIGIAGIGGILTGSYLGITRSLQTTHNDAISFSIRQ